MKLYGNPVEAITETSNRMRDMSLDVHPSKWQGFDVADKPEADMKEILNWSFQFPMITNALDFHRRQINPNLPWADNHFDERVGFEPLNPGETWKDWPWANKADESRIFDSGEKFSHTYMERYWPREVHKGSVMKGHRFEYGDLEDIVDLLAREPDTRQAYLPIFFPEDTGANHGNRVPCTLGYHWIHRNGYLHVFYPIRSCDFYRHFRDDIYLTIRLTLWILDELYKRDDVWLNVKPGMFSMWIGSLHMFINDYNKLYGGEG